MQGGSVSASPIDYLTWAQGVQGPSLRAMDDPDDFHRIGQHGYAMINGSGSLAGASVLVDPRALVAGGASLARKLANSTRSRSAAGSGGTSPRFPPIPLRANAGTSARRLASATANPASGDPSLRST